MRDFVLAAFHQWPHRRREILTESRNSGKDVDIAVCDHDGNPHILSREDKLLAQVSRLIRRQLNHPELCLLSWRILVPVELLLRWVWSGQLLHPLVGLLVEGNFQPKGFGDGVIRDIVVPDQIISIMRLLDCHTRALRWPNPSAGDHEVVFVAHPTNRLDDLGLVICYDLDSLQSLRGSY